MWSSLRAPRLIRHDEPPFAGLSEDVATDEACRPLRLRTNCRSGRTDGRSQKIDDLVSEANIHALVSSNGPGPQAVFRYTLLWTPASFRNKKLGLCMSKN